MSNIKLVVTDLDGTVVRPLQDELSPRVLDAIHACEAAGVKVCAVTGRPYEQAKNILVAMGFEDPCIFNGGATIRNPITGEIVWRQWLSLATVRQIMAIVLPHSSLIDYASQYDVRSVEGVKPEDAVEDASDVWCAVPVKKADDLLAEINKLPGVIAHNNGAHGGDPHTFGIQVTHKSADKFHGVQALLSIMQVKPEEVLGIGDGNNDLPLLAAAGTKIAMGNATDLLKNAAEHVVSTVEQDGFAEALERFVLDK